jgi:hypothetical protein
VQAVERERGVQDEAGLQELDLPELPLVVLLRVGELRRLELPEELQWEDDGIGPPSNLWKSINVHQCMVVTGNHGCVHCA